MRQTLLAPIRRVVVKFGTGILTDATNRLDQSQIESLVSQIAALHQRGLDVIVVSSGAVGAGMGLLRLEERPSRLEDLQALAAVGQPHLVSAYDRLFSERGIVIAQALLTHDDLNHRERHLNARSTLVSLLNKRVIPIINENDAVSFTELKFGDNDRLSALVACLIPCDLLVILTSADGLMVDYGGPNQRTVSQVDALDDSIYSLASGPGSATSTGGMVTKLEAAQICVRAGIPALIGPGRRPNVLMDLLDGRDVGTLFLPNAERLPDRKRWIAFYHHPKGAVVVDEGAKRALRDRHEALRVVGACRVEGSFVRGDVVSIYDEEGTEFARGLAEFASESVDAEARDREAPLVLAENLALF